MINTAGLTALLLVTSVPAVRAGERVRWHDDTRVIWACEPSRARHEAVVSSSDWFVFYDAFFETPGTRAIINEAAAAGVRTVWWRMFGGGLALYPTRVDEATARNHSLNDADFGVYDGPADAVDFAHRLGLKLYAWLTPLEEAHAWPFNSRARYANRHRDLWDRLPKGDPAGAPSLCYDEYLGYKLAFVREILERYEVDGIAIDLERRGAPGRGNTWGYLPQELNAFRVEQGLPPDALPEPEDPAWQAFRARLTGRYVEGVRRLTEGREDPVEVVLMVPARPRLHALWDTERWIAARWIDRLALLAHPSEGWGYTTNQAPQVYQAAQDLGIPLSVVLYAGRSLPEEERSRRVAAAVGAGFPYLTWFETQYLHNRHRYRYHLLRRHAMPDTVRLRSPERDFSNGGTLDLLASGDWSVRLPDSELPLAEGRAGGPFRVTVPARQEGTTLIFECRVADRSPRVGFAVQGHAIGRQGRQVLLVSDASWTADEPAHAPVLVVADTGVPPFLGDAAVQEVLP